LSPTEPIVVERAMYFPNEGTEAMGVTNPSTVWYLAEGYTENGFGTFILIQNPNAVNAEVTVTYMLTDSTTVHKEFTVSSNSRFTVVAADDETFGVGIDKTFSTTIESTQPVIVERAMYWANGDNIQAGHDSPGLTGTAFSWNLAEGYTGDGFDTRILVQNPNDVQANIEITYMLMMAVQSTNQWIYCHMPGSPLLDLRIICLALGRIVLCYSYRI